jgi:hypothetical protein
VPLGKILKSSQWKDRLSAADAAPMVWGVVSYLWSLLVSESNSVWRVS